MAVPAVEAADVPAILVQRSLAIRKRGDAAVWQHPSLRHLRLLQWKGRVDVDWTAWVQEPISAKKDLCMMHKAVPPHVLHDASAHLVFCAVPNALVPGALASLEACGRDASFSEPCTWYVAPAESADLTASQPGPCVGDRWTVQGCEYELCRGTVADVPVFMAKWKYASPHNAALVREQVATLPSALIRATASQEPVAWCISQYDGSIGMLHVVEPHRRRGLARAVVSGLLRMRAECGMCGPDSCPTLAFIADYNTASQRLFASLGWQRGGAVTWLVAGRCKLPSCSPQPLVLGAASEGTQHSTLAAWEQLMALINCTYRQDDAFFVDQVRVQWEEVLAVARAVSRPVQGRPAAMLLGTVTEPGAPEAVPQAVAGWWQSNKCDAFAPTAPPASLVCAAHVQGSVLDSSSSAAAPTETRLMQGVQQGAPFLAVHLGWLAVSPLYKGRGGAACIMAAVERWCRAAAADAGVRAVLLLCDIVSVKPWLLKWYTQQQGFKVHGTRAWPTHLVGRLKRDVFFYTAHKVLRA